MKYSLQGTGAGHLSPITSYIYYRWNSLFPTSGGAQMFHRKSKSILISITMVMSIVIAILIYIGINIYLNQKASVVIKNNSQNLEKQILNLSNTETTTFERLSVFEWDTVYICTI